MPHYTTTLYPEYIVNINIIIKNSWVSIKLKLLDTSSELIITRFQNGVKLIAPEYNDGLNTSANAVGHIMQLPMNVVFPEY